MLSNSLRRLVSPNVVPTHCRRRPHLQATEPQFCFSLQRKSRQCISKGTAKKANVDSLCSAVDFGGSRATRRVAIWFHEWIPATPHHKQSVRHSLGETTRHPSQQPNFCFGWPFHAGSCRVVLYNVSSSNILQLLINFRHFVCFHDWTISGLATRPWRCHLEYRNHEDSLTGCGRTAA
jgi:hypothetical protein